MYAIRSYYGSAENGIITPMDGITFVKGLNGGTPVGGVYYFCGEDAYSLNKGVRAVIERTNSYNFV